MSKPALLQATAYEDGGVTLMARVNGWANTAINQASVSTLSLKVYEYATESEAKRNIDGTVLTGIGGTLTVASHVFDTLQTGGTWTKDTTGYNFRYVATGDHLPNGGKWYRFEFKFTPASGPVFWLAWIVEALGVASE